MAVGTIPEDEIMDVDADGRVISLDARIILQAAVGWSTEVDPTVVVTTDEDTVYGIMNSKKPVDTFLDAYDSGTVRIEAVGIIKSITLAVGNIVLKIVRMLDIL